MECFNKICEHCKDCEFKQYYKCIDTVTPCECEFCDVLEEEE